MKINTPGGLACAGVWGALLGSMAGFAAGLLLAPEEGQRTRRRLVYQLENMTLRTGLFLEGFFSQEGGSEARRTGDALVADAQERAQRIRHDIDVLLEEMRKQQRAGTSEGASPSAR